MNPFQINRDRTIDQDAIFLVDRLFHPIQNGEIYPVSDLKVTANLNNNWECQFTVYRETDGIPNPLWNQITDLALIKIEHRGIFELEAPVTDEAGTFKQCSGKSICEAETSQTLITLEINTEDDISRESRTNPADTYYEEFPTIFYRDINDISVFNHLKNSHHAALLKALRDDEKREILRKSSLLHRIFSEMPEYAENINGENIDDSLKSLQYTFSWSGTSVYEICQDIAEEIQCIFIFDRFRRSFEVRDLKDHCEIDGCRDIQDGICPICQKNGTTPKISSFGEYSGVEIDTYNLAETITLSGNKDSVKNYFKIEGADDIITNRISNRLIGNGYLWKTGSLQRSQMSKELLAALEERERMMTENYDAGSPYQNIQDEYNQLWDQWNTLEQQILEYQSGMMPSPETADKKAEDIFEYLFGTDGKINSAYASNQFQTASQIADSVMNYAKLLISTGHTLEYDSLTYQTETWEGHENIVTSITFQPHIYLDGHYLDEQNSIDTQNSENDQKKPKYADEYPTQNPISITLKVIPGYHITTKDEDGKSIYTTEYYNYLRHILDTAMAKSDITDEILTMDPATPHNISPEATSFTDPNTQEIHPLPSTHYSKYCYNRLDSFCKSFTSCTTVLSKENGKISTKGETVDILNYLKPDGSTSSNIQADLLGKYQQYIELLSARMQWLNFQISSWKTDQETLMERIQEIKKICDMEYCLVQYARKNNPKQNLWHELCSFKRQDTYRNENFAGEGISEADLMQNVEDLLKRAEEEIESACNITYSATATIGNLLVMPEFKPFWNKFDLGNYIHMVIDGQIHTMRLTGITYDYSDLSHCSVEFSDVIRKTNSKTEEIANILSKATSLASSAKTLSRQAEQGKEAKLTIDAIKNDALNLAHSKIITADDQDFTIDQYGITGKYTNPVSGEVSSEQIRIINNLLCFTDDNWQHTQTALGKIQYQNPETNQYETKYGLIADTLIGNLILGEKLMIQDINGSVQIDGNGILLDSGAIHWKNEIPPKEIQDLDQELTSFRTNLNLALGTTTISSDSVISPKIGGGYAYFVDGNNSILLNPHSEPVPNCSGTTSAKDEMFHIISNNKSLLTVNKSGSLQLGFGELGKTDTVLFSPTGITSREIIAGSSGENKWAMTANNHFGVTTDGELYAEKANITGKITATSGIFSGQITSNDINMTGGNLYLPINTDNKETADSEKIIVSTNGIESTEGILLSGHKNINSDDSNSTKKYINISLQTDESSFTFQKDVTYQFSIQTTATLGFYSSFVHGLLGNSSEINPSSNGLHSFQCIKKDIHTFVIFFKGNGSSYSHLCLLIPDAEDYSYNHQISFQAFKTNLNASNVSISPNKIEVCHSDLNSVIKSELHNDSISFTNGNYGGKLSFDASGELSSNTKIHAPNLQEKEWAQIYYYHGNFKNISTSSVFSIATELIIQISAFDSNGNLAAYTWYVNPDTISSPAGIHLLSGYKTGNFEGFAEVLLGRDIASIQKLIVSNTDLTNQAKLTISYR